MPPSPILCPRETPRFSQLPSWLLVHPLLLLPLLPLTLQVPLVVPSLSPYDAIVPIRGNGDRGKRSVDTDGVAYDAYDVVYDDDVWIGGEDYQLPSPVVGLSPFTLHLILWLPSQSCSPGPMLVLVFVMVALGGGGPGEVGRQGEEGMEIVGVDSVLILEVVGWLGTGIGVSVGAGAGSSSGSTRMSWKGERNFATVSFLGYLAAGKFLMHCQFSANQPDIRHQDMGSKLSTLLVVMFADSPPIDGHGRNFEPNRDAGST